MKILLLLFLFNISLLADYYRVFLADKGPDKIETNSELYQRTIELLSEETIERRRLTLGEQIITQEDLPLYTEYISELEKFGNIKHKIKWFNYVLIDINENDTSKIKELDFVDRIQKSTSKLLAQNTKDVAQIDYLSQIMETPYQYGDGLVQIEMLGVDELHSMGFNGENSIIGFLDSGFDPTGAQVKNPENYLGEYDFVSMDENTNFEEGDSDISFHHGTSVMSTVLGFLDSALVGVSTGSRYAMARTEDTGSETQVEVDNFIAGIEWLEAKGCNVVNSSLGYRFFNDTDSTYNFNDFTGNSMLISQAVNKSVHRGVVHATSAGNYGGNDSSLVAPADADSVLSVAGVNREEMRWGGSSQGPRAGDENIYPNIAALGNRVAFSAVTDSTPVIAVGSGTSFASPIIAGCVSLLRSAFPNLRPWEIRQILFESSSQYDTPDFQLGYGIPDMRKAFNLAGIAIANPSYYDVSSEFTRIATFIYSESEIDIARILVFNPETELLEEIEMKTLDGIIYYADLGEKYFEEETGTARYYIEAYDSESENYLPYSKEPNLLAKREDSRITDGVDAKTLPTQIDSDPDTSVDFVQDLEVVINQNQISISNFSFSYGDVRVQAVNTLGQRIFESTGKVRNGEYSILSLNLATDLIILLVEAENQRFVKKVAISE